MYAPGAHRQGTVAEQRALALIVQHAVQSDLYMSLTAEQSGIAIEQFGTTQAQPIAAGDYSLVLVEHAWRGDAQTTVSNDFAATVVQLLSEIQRRHALAGNLAGTVVHLPGIDDHTSVAGDATSAVVDFVGVEGQRALSRQLSPVLHQRTEFGTQFILGDDTPLGVVRLIGRQLQAAFGDQRASVVFQAGHTDIDGALAADGATTVVQDECLDIQTSSTGDNPLEAVVQGLRDTQGQGSTAEQASTLVVQRGGGKSERAVAGDFPTAVVHHAELAQKQGARRGDQALSAIDQASLVQIERDAGIADQAAPVMLVQPLESRIDRTLGSDPARLAVVYPSGDQGESRIAADTGFPAVVQVAGTNLHGPLATDRTGLAVVEAGAAQAKSGVARQSAALIVQGALAGHCQCPCAG